MRAPEVAHKLATRHRASGDAARAQQFFIRLSELAFSSDVAIAKRANLLIGSYLRECGRWVDAAEHYAAIKDAYPEEAEDIIFQLAQSQFAAGEYTEAANSYRDFAEQFPNNPQLGYARLRIEEATRNLKQYDTALDYLRSVAAEEGPIEADALIRQAELVGGYQNNIGAALEICQQLTEKFSTSSRIMGLVEFTRGHLCLSKLRKPAEAREHFLSMLQQYPDKNLNIEAACHIASTYSMEGDYVTAERLFAKAATEYESPVKCWRGYAWYMLGDCLTKDGKIEEAKAAFEKVVKDFGECEWAELARKTSSALEGKW